MPEIRFFKEFQVEFLLSIIWNVNFNNLEGDCVEF